MSAPSVSATKSSLFATPDGPSLATGPLPPGKIGLSPGHYR